MKRHLFLSLIMILSLTVVETFGQAENQIKNSLNTLFNLSSAKNYQKAASYIAYSGNDKSRYLNDTYNANDKEELNQVKRICKKIAALKDISDKYSIVSITKKFIDKREISFVEVDFTSGEQKLKTQFEFIRIGDKFVLAEIN